jgi:hypothetical protein
LHIDVVLFSETHLKPTERFYVYYQLPVLSNRPPPGKKRHPPTTTGCSRLALRVELLFWRFPQFKIMKIEMFAILDKAKPDTENI